MIDTIILYIRGLEKYTVLLNQIQKDEAGKKTSIYLKEDQAEALLHKDVFYTFYHDSNTFIPLASNGSLSIGSWSYNLSFFVDRSKDKIKFEFSIPKYLYGTNVLQFVNYYDVSADAIFLKLMDFIKMFCRNFICPVDLEDVEIGRLDLCYNQFFNTKKQSLAYLDAQKVYCQREAKKLGRIPQITPTSWYLVKDNYSMKVYHKGTEFKKHDYKTLVGKSVPYSLQHMADVADKILRYEITYRKSHFDYLFKKLYFEGRSKKATVYKYLFNTLRIDGEKCLARSYCISSLFDFHKELQKTNPYIPGSKSPGWIEFFEGVQCVTFNRELFGSLYVKFWNFVKEYQIPSSGYNTNFEALIKKINDGYVMTAQLSGKKVSLKDEKTLLFWMLASQKTPLKEYVSKGLLTRMQHWRILKEFAKVGLSDFNPIMNSTKPSIDYSSYRYHFAAFH